MLKKVTTHEDSKTDTNQPNAILIKIALPYTYKKLKCTKCKEETKYVKKLWFNFYDYYKLDQEELLCDDCSLIKEKKMK